MKRRPFLKMSAFSLLALNLKSAWSQDYKFDFAKAKQGYLNRINSIKKSGTLPIIDVESAYNPLNFDAKSFIKAMDRAGLAQVCLSLNQPKNLVDQGAIWNYDSDQLAIQYPEYFIPTGNGGNEPAWTKNSSRFLDENEKNIILQKIPLMGEFEFRHYPSPRQVQRRADRDVDIPIDGPLGHRLFSFAEKSGVPFQIHYEIEDSLLGPLEKMMTQYPKAKVIWCHLAQIRYAARSSIYSPEYLGALLEKHKNLYIDTAFGTQRSQYPLSGELHARYWANQDAWNKLIIAKPYRFLAALDLGGDRIDRLGEWTQNLRFFLQQFPDEVAEIVAYKATWKLLFNEV
jgi:Amidohydrolase